MKTQIANKFTGYEATIQTKGLPSVSTIKKHIRKSKASDCLSVTEIHIDGHRYHLTDRGMGLELLAE